MLKKKMNKWNDRFMGIAQYVATWSKQKHPIGAVIVGKDRNIISTGYNGFPNKIKDTAARLKEKALSRDLCIHAEQNAILHAKCDLTGCSLYVYGYMCCSKCALLIIQSGISKIYYKDLPGHVVSEFWRQDFELSKSLLKEAGVKLIQM